MATPIGLLGGVNEEEMQNQAMKMAALQAGLTGLMASGPSLAPVSTGQVLGQMGAAGVGAYQQGLQQAQQMQVQKQIQQATQSALGGGQGGGKVDGAAMAERLKMLATQLMPFDPKRAKEYLDMAEKYKVDVSKYTGEMANLAYTKFGTSNINDLTSAQRNELDQEYQQRKMNVAARQAPVIPTPVVNVSYGKSFGGDLAGKQVDMLANSYKQGESAVNTIGLLDRMQPIVGEAFTGPGSTVQTALVRIGEQLGITGKDATQKLVNTATLIQDAAKMELAGAEQMRGTGAITDNERQLLQRAASVDIKTLTAPEISQLLDIMRKTSTYRIGQHNQTLDKFIKTQPDAAPQLEIYRIAPPVPVRRR